LIRILPPARASIAKSGGFLRGGLSAALVEPFTAMAALHTETSGRELRDPWTTAGLDLIAQCPETHATIGGDDGERIDDKIIDGRGRIGPLFWLVLDWHWKSPRFFEMIRECHRCAQFLGNIHLRD
jgi:hypothetical protein